MEKYLTTAGGKITCVVPKEGDGVLSMLRGFISYVYEHEVSVHPTLCDVTFVIKCRLL